MANAYQISLRALAQYVAPASVGRLKMQQLRLGFASSAEGKDPQSQPAEVRLKGPKCRSPSRLSAESNLFDPKRRSRAQNTAIPTVNKITIDSEYYSVAFPSKLSFFAAAQRDFWSAVRPRPALKAKQWM